MKKTIDERIALHLDRSKEGEMVILNHKGWRLTYHIKTDNYTLWFKNQYRGAWTKIKDVFDIVY